MASSPDALEDRLICFAVHIASRCERMPRTYLGRHVAGQMVRSSSGAFANYGEARAGESRRDFIHKLRLSLKELRELLNWIRFGMRAGLLGRADHRMLDEANQLVAIFVSSVKTAERNSS